MSGFHAKGTTSCGGFRLPWFEMQHLAVAVKRQHVSLRDYTRVALLSSFLVAKTSASIV